MRAGCRGEVPPTIFTELSISNQQAVLLLTALIIVAVILMLVYRSPSCGCPPLITIGKLG